MKKLILFLAIIVCFNSTANSQLIYYQWNPVSSPVTNNLNFIYNNATNYVIACNDGKIIYRNPQQTNWIIAPTIVTSNFLAISSTLIPLKSIPAAESALSISSCLITSLKTMIPYLW